MSSLYFSTLTEVGDGERQMVIRQVNILRMRTCFFLLFTCLFASCSSPKTEDFYGSWEYIKVENPEQVPPRIASEEELKENSPSIVFHPDGKLEMIWGAKVLSHGTFKLEYPNIVYKEELDSGKSRDIRFLIKRFEKDSLVFQTQEADPVRVTARKAK